MLFGNQMEKALEDKNMLTKRRKKREPKLKIFKCTKCGEPMLRIQSTNVMACSSCKNWYLFDFVK